MVSPGAKPGFDASTGASVGSEPSGLVRAPGLEAGRTYAVWFPFKREKYQPHREYDEGGGPQCQPPERDTWVPGWTTEMCGEYAERADLDWDGDGAMLLTVVSLHKPGPTYPERAFYVRQWRDPDGRVFGKANLRCITASALKSWLKGSKTAHLFTDRRGSLEASRALFLEAMALAAADTSGVNDEVPGRTKTTTPTHPSPQPKGDPERGDAPGKGQ